MSARDVTTQVGRISYPHLFERQAPMTEGEEGKFGASIIFAEGTDLSSLKAAIAAAAAEKFGETKARELMKAGKLRRTRFIRVRKYGSMSRPSVTTVQGTRVSRWA